MCLILIQMMKRARVLSVEHDGLHLYGVSYILITFPLVTPFEMFINPYSLFYFFSFAPYR